VEDCGRDESWSIICELACQFPNITGIKLSRNYGQHNALLCGIRAAKGNVIVTMDDDLQHPPEELPKLLEKLSEGFDVVYGAPEKEPHGFLRGLASQITKLVLQKSMGAETARQISALRAFKAKLSDAFEDYRNPSVNIDVMLTWVTTNFSVVKVRHEQRKSGVSGYTMRMLIRHAFNMMTGFSALPLQMASITGFVFALFGFLVLAYVLIRYFAIGAVVPGFAFLASIIAVFSGAQLLAIGVIGEYLARIHFRTMERPPFIVRERTSERDSDDS
jgi:glycosyltransferase involved in cell wall biosynthesis